MITTMPNSAPYMNRKAPVVPLRRLVLLVHGKFGLSPRCYLGFATGAVLMVGGRFLPEGFFDITQYLGVCIFIGSIGLVLFDLGSNDMRAREERASDAVKLMDHGVSNPSRHRKQNPEMVAAYEALADELGISLSSLTHRSRDDNHLYEIALLVLSGRVAAEDAHLLVTAVNRGVTDSEEVVSMVKDMKAHGYALAEGAL